MAARICAGRVRTKRGRDACNGTTHHKESHAEDADEDNLLLQGQAGVDEEGYGNGEHEGVGTDVKACLCYRIKLERGALRLDTSVMSLLLDVAPTLTIRRRHSPVSFERPACKEEGELCTDVAARYVYGQRFDETSMFQLHCQACIDAQHAHFQRVYKVEHRLVISINRCTQPFSKKPLTCSETTTILDPCIRSVMSSLLNVEYCSGG